MSERPVIRWTVVSVLGLSGLLGCGTVPPPVELLDARAAYEKASRGQAAQLAPAQLDTAKQALSKAEGSFEEEGDDPVTKDLAYVAQRRAEIAEAEAGRENAERTRAQTDKSFRETELDAMQQHRKTREQLEQEKKAREAAEKRSAEAEKKLASAMASLTEIAKVKEESRGMVITLSGAVLFATGRSELLPIAQVPNLSRALELQKKNGLWMVALEAGPDSKPLTEIDLKGSIGLILGSEGDGIRKGVLGHADFRGSIPMRQPGIGSLNVSVAAGIALAEVTRQRG